jgi:multidrug efflux pump subunit AcrB
MKKSKTPPSTLITKISRYFYNHIKVSATVWLALLTFGVLSYSVLLQRQGFPPVEVPISVVQGVYFVNDKQVVDEQFTKPLIELADSIPEVKATRANSITNALTLIIEYDDNTSSIEGSKLVEEKVKANSSKLPPEAQINYVPIDATRYNNKYDVLLSVSAKNKNIADIVSIADSVANDIDERIPEVEKIEVLQPFTKAINPQTGVQENQQTSFDWTGERRNGSVSVQQSVVIGLTIDASQDIIAFDNSLNQTLATIDTQDKYRDVRISNAASFAPNIRSQIQSLQSNLAQGLVIVVLVCLLFIGLRAGILAAITMLMTLSVTAGALYAMGLSLNTITLFGLVLCLGLIVDDTVIVVEAIDAKRKAKEPVKDAALGAISKIAFASAAGTFTTILGFAPLLFIGGILGEFIRVLPITIITALLISLAVSLVFVPFLSRWLLNKPYIPNKFYPLATLRQAIFGLGTILSRLVLSATSTKKKITRTLLAVTISFVFIVVSFPIFTTLKFDIFPSTKDANELQIEYSFAPNTSIDEAKRITADANTKIVKTLGVDLEKITYLGNANSRQATANIMLTPLTSRDVTSQQFVSDLETTLNTIDGVQIRVSQISSGPPKDQYPFKVQIDADNPAQASQVATKLVSYLSETQFSRPNGTTFDISAVDYTGENIAVTRVDGQRIVQVSASFDATDTSTLVQITKEAIENEFLSKDSNLAGLSKDKVAFDFGSESDNQDSFQSVLVALPLLLLAMYLLLVLQFRSLLQPILILLAVPFSFFGVAAALYLTNNPLSFFVMIGFFALIGITVNNSILLTDYANQGRRNGLSPRIAVSEAIKLRTRPLLTTSLTSVLALVPLAVSDPFWESLAVTLIGGLTSSTLLVLIAFPYYYLGLEALRSRSKIKFKQLRKNK